MADEKLTKFGVPEGAQVPLDQCRAQAASVKTGGGFQFIPTRGATLNLAEAEREAAKILSDARREAEAVRKVLAAEQAAAGKAPEAAPPAKTARTPKEK